MWVYLEVKNIREALIISSAALHLVFIWDGKPHSAGDRTSVLTGHKHSGRKCVGAFMGLHKWPRICVVWEKKKTHTRQRCPHLSCKLKGPGVITDKTSLTVVTEIVDTHTHIRAIISTEPCYSSFHFMDRKLCEKMSHYGNNRIFLPSTSVVGLTLTLKGAANWKQMVTSAP